ncbi:MAG: hypothetical protein ACOYMA_05255 [Bacteroidia bacterium]
MKNNLKLAQLIAALVFSTLLVGCVKEDTVNSTLSNKNCTPTKLPSLIRSISLNDLKSSAGSQPVVAIFKFLQELESYEEANCKTLKPKCKVNLMIQNTTAKKMLFDYTITYISGANIWQFQNYSIIEPNKLEDIGLIAQNCGWISGGTLTVTSNNINFE